MIKGTPVSILNHGTIVQLILKTRNGLATINFDWRMFKDFYEAEKPLNNKILEYNPKTQIIRVVE